MNWFPFLKPDISLITMTVADQNADDKKSFKLKQTLLAYIFSFVNVFWKCYPEHL